MSHPTSFGHGPLRRVISRVPFVYQFHDPPADYATQPKLPVRFTRAVHRGQTAWHASALWNGGEGTALPQSEAEFLIASGVAVPDTTEAA
jgi:hypothetical protein